MLNNFIKKIKINLLYIKNKLLFFIKLVNLKLIFNIAYFYVVYDCFTTIKNHSLFICSSLNTFINYINPSNLSIFLSFYFILSLRFFIFLKLKNSIKLKSLKLSNNSILISNNSYNKLYLQVLYYVYNKTTLIVNINYLYYWYLTFINCNIKNSYFLNYTVISLLDILKPINWYTVFKRHSYFGFYRITRQRWTELKSEEVNYLKY